MPLTDDILLQYADGRLDVERAAQVAAALARDDIASERLRLMRISGHALHLEATRGTSKDKPEDLARQFLGATQAEPVVAAKRSRPATPARANRLRPIQALAASLILAVGIGVGVLATTLRDSTRHPLWVMRVVDYHTLYGRSTVAGSSVSPAEVTTLEQRFTLALGQRVKIPAYSGTDMEFRRGQILEFERAPIIQLAYLPPREGTPMALCLKRGGGNDLAPTFQRIHDIGMIRWRRGGIDYVLVGDQDEQALQTYASQAIEQIAAAGQT